jgi:hypothetical protein
LAAAIGAISAALQASYNDMELAVALNLTFQSVEEFAFKLGDFPASQTCHVNMITLWTTLIEVLFSLHMHEVKLINQTVALQQIQSAVDGHTINPRIKFAGFAQDLTGIQVLFGGFHNTKNSAALMRHAQTARHQLGLQPPGSFCLRKRQMNDPELIETLLQLQ